MPRAPRTPTYRLHRPSGQAVVTLAGRDVYLGRWNSPESVTEYRRLVAEYHANGGRAPARADAPRTVAEIILPFWKHATTYYRHPDGTPTGELSNYRDVLRPLKELYGGSGVRAAGVEGGARVDAQAEDRHRPEDRQAARVPRLVPRGGERSHRTPPPRLQVGDRER